MIERAVTHAINRAEVAATQTLQHFVATFNEVAHAMLQKPDLLGAELTGIKRCGHEAFSLVERKR